MSVAINSSADLYSNLQTLLGVILPMHCLLDKENLERGVKQSVHTEF